MGHRYPVREPIAAWRRTTVCLASAIFVLSFVASCAAEDDADRSATTAATSPADRPTTTPTTPSEGPTPASPATALGDPQPCSGQEPYSTSPDWHLDQLPEGFILDQALAPSTYVEHVDGSPYSSLTRFLLVELDDEGGVIADLVVQRWGDLEQFEPESTTSAGFAVSERGADSVRGHDGHVVRVINRGDPVGHAEARWVEGGAGWAAWSTSEPDLDAFADALVPLSLTDEVSDPEGRFVVVGRSTFPDEWRRTRIFLTSVEAPSAVSLTFDIENPAPGDRGITDLHPSDNIRHLAGLTVSEPDGRAVIANEIATRTTLPDGTVVSLQERRTDGSPLALDAADRLALIDQLEPVDVEEWWSELQPGRDGFCREGTNR